LPILRKDAHTRRGRLEILSRLLAWSRLPILSSPDLTPPDFYLFGYLKDRLQGQHFTDGDQLFDAIMAVTGTIEKVTLQRVFLEWMERLRRWIDTNGEYIGGPN
jgi:hypothetical protein